MTVATDPAAPLTFDAARAAATATGQRFETAVVDLDGRPTTVFANAPASLRDWWATARTRPDETYLVYEDERWSFADVMARVDGLAHALVHDLGVTKGDRVAIGMRNYRNGSAGSPPSRASVRSPSR